MIGEIVEIISDGVRAVLGVTKIIKMRREQNSSNITQGIESSIQNIDNRLLTVEKELHNQEQNEPKLLAAYSILIKALQDDKNYSSQLRFVPTDYGTWKIIRKRTRKMITLRDPNGEY